jgi:hypothetical protein
MMNKAEMIVKAAYIKGCAASGVEALLKRLENGDDFDSIANDVINSGGEYPFEQWLREYSMESSHKVSHSHDVTPLMRHFDDSEMAIEVADQWIGFTIWHNPDADDVVTSFVFLKCEKVMVEKLIFTNVVQGE